jgi:hypothetical protein
MIWIESTSAQQVRDLTHNNTSVPDGARLQPQSIRTPRMVMVKITAEFTS